jgi:hypothetical protein
MGEVVNLRRARKAKVRAQARVEAQANRALHGRTMEERKRDTIEAERLVRTVEGSRVARDFSESEPSEPV